MRRACMSRDGRCVHADPCRRRCWRSARNRRVQSGDAPQRYEEGRRPGRARRAGQQRASSCVDMLGEGFDMPELKIAAFHDLRRPLPLHCCSWPGCFTRS